MRNEPIDTTGLIPLEAGGYQPLLGKSYPEIAAASRSMHKSQGFGVEIERGERKEYFKFLEGETDPGQRRDFCRDRHDLGARSEGFGDQRQDPGAAQEIRRDPAFRFSRRAARASARHCALSVTMIGRRKSSLISTESSPPVSACILKR